jgi:hypothetical protein
MISVISAINDPILEIPSGGSPAVELIIQTGTLVVDFSGTADNDWTRDSLSYPVFALPLTTAQRITQATACASPSSFGYGAASSYAVSDVSLSAGPLPDDYPPPFGKPTYLPVSGAVPVNVPIPGSGWAVDQTTAQISGRDVLLNANLAVFGGCVIYRVAYSVFITVTLGPIDPNRAPHP